MSPIESIKQALASKNTQLILRTLNELEAEQTQELVTEICRLAYHYDYKVREAAFKALGKVRHLDLSEVISDGLKDPRREVFQAAARIFHDTPKAA